MRWKCDACGKPVPPLGDGRRPARCNSCGTWEKVVPADKWYAQAPGGPRRLTEGELRPPREQRIQLGVPSVNRLFGGDDPEREGFVKGMTYVISGDPGAGKSTLALQLLMGLDFDAVYVGCEGERHEQLRERADRIGRSCSNVLYLSAENVVEAIPKTKGYRVKLYDSLDANVNVGHAMLKCLDAICLDAEEEDAVAIVVRQVNADGYAAGPVALGHRVQATSHLSVGDDGSRFLVVEKNRGARTWRDVERAKKSKKTGQEKTIRTREPMALALEMTEKGLIEAEGQED